VGLAYAGRYNGEDNATVCFIGDGGTSEGDFHEGLNFAAVWNLPVVYIVQNNQWAISIPRSAQTSSRTLAQKALAFDIPCLQVDGNDALAMWVAINEALDHARSARGRP
jgi:pyruvate dehydrogenase E1 component alpha subunit